MSFEKRSSAPPLREALPPLGAQVQELLEVHGVIAVQGEAIIPHQSLEILRGEIVELDVVSFFQVLLRHQSDLLGTKSKGFHGLSP